MTARSVERALFLHALMSIVLGVLPVAAAGRAGIPGLLLPAWGFGFFMVFFLRGQAVRPRPSADLVTGFRFLLAVIFYLLALAGRMSAAAALVLVLMLEAADGLDGWLARRHGPTEFGGVLDMESDAFIILLMSVSAILTGDRPVWALWPGLIRYVFFFVFLVLKPESASFSRALSWFSKTVCVVTVFALASTWYLPGLSTAAIGAASVLLTVSFGWETVSYVVRRIQTRKR